VAPAASGGPLQYRQVYSTLARLLKRGFVEVDGVEPGGGPERKRYAITRCFTWRPICAGWS
jgi:DNA-binding PadR family transcriptional regulator